MHTSPSSTDSGLSRRIRRGLVRRAERWLDAVGLVAPRPTPIHAPPAATPSEQPRVVPDPAPEPDPAGLDPAAVQALLDDMVRPALQADGGDITLVRVVGGEVHVQLVGACSSCPSSVLTMKVGIERLLEEELPGFTRLIQVGEAPTPVDDH